MNSNELLRLLLNLLRKGTVSAVDHAAEMCRVKSGDLETNWIRWCALSAGQTVDWNPPSVNEQVLLICPGGDPADAVALCGIYSDASPAPSHKPSTHTRKYPDQTVLEYDHELHKYLAKLPPGGIVELIAPESVKVTTKLLTVEGGARVTKDMAVDGKTNLTGKVTAAGDVAVGGNVTVAGGVTVGDGATGVFTAKSGQTVVVKAGIVISIT